MITTFKFVTLRSLAFPTTVAKVPTQSVSFVLAPLVCRTAVGSGPQCDGHCCFAHDGSLNDAVTSHRSVPLR